MGGIGVASRHVGRHVTGVRVGVGRTRVRGSEFTPTGGPRDDFDTGVVRTGFFLTGQGVGALVSVPPVAGARHVGGICIHVYIYFTQARRTQKTPSEERSVPLCSVLGWGYGSTKNPPP